MKALLGIDAHGRITGLNCHDGNLNMLDVRNKDNLMLGVRLVDGSERIISFGEVTKLYVKNFREGNIIDSFSLWSIDSIPKVAVQMALELSGTENLSNIFSFTEKNKYLLILESSYGANFCAAIETFYSADDYINNKISF